MPTRRPFRTLALALAAALGLLSGPAPARGDEPPKIVTRVDLVYTKVGDAELKLDLARPEGDGPFPAVVAIHGGAWRAGDKSQVHGAVVELARRGYVAISPQYRFCPKETFPAQVHDVKAAVRWLKANAAEHRVDAEHVGAMGFSAGGHLALMLGVTGPDDGLEGDAPSGAPSTRIQAVVNYFGPSDLSAADIPTISRPLLRDFLGGPAEEKREAAAKASPLTYVTRDDPPILTFQGTKDPLVPYNQATKLLDALSRAGVGGRVEILIGAGHGWGGDELRRTERETLEFFDRHLKPRPGK